MATLGGKHSQAHTGRELTYWCAFEVVGETNLCYVATVNEDRALLGQHEATLRHDPYGIPADAIVRMNICQHLDQRSFDKGKLPDPEWIGWHGPYL